MARIIVCDRCGKTTGIDRMYMHIKRCKWVYLSVETIGDSEKVMHLCDDCSKEFARWMKARKNT